MKGRKSIEWKRNIIGGESQLEAGNKMREFWIDRSTGRGKRLEGLDIDWKIKEGEKSKGEKGGEREGVCRRGKSKCGEGMVGRQSKHSMIVEVRGKASECEVAR